MSADSHSTRRIPSGKPAKARVLIFLLFAMVAFAACGGGHFLTDDAYRARVHDDFLKRRELAASRDRVLFSVLDRTNC